jgi:hypothetical protein
LQNYASFTGEVLLLLQSNQCSALRSFVFDNELSVLEMDAAVERADAYLIKSKI